MADEDPYRAQAADFALGVLDDAELAAFAAHLATGCEGCRAEVDRHQAAVHRLPGTLEPRPPAPRLREQVLDLAEAPRLPLELSDYAWDEVVPGVKIHVLKEDPARGVRACLVWAQPGARHPLHRHLGDENILVLQGAVRDQRGVYGPGEICRSRAGSSHTEEAMPGEDCLCYVVYYGGLEMLEG